MTKQSKRHRAAASKAEALEPMLLEALDQVAGIAIAQVALLSVVTFAQRVGQWY